MTKKKKPRDFLDEMIEESTARNPHFPALLEAAGRRRELLQQLAEERRARHLSQTTVAAQMATSQSSLARLERQSDALLSTLDRYAAALGKELHLELRDAA